MIHLIYLNNIQIAAKNRQNHRQRRLNGNQKDKQGSEFFLTKNPYKHELSTQRESKERFFHDNRTQKQLICNDMM